MSIQPETSAVPEWDLADRMRKALRVSGLGVQEMADYLEVSRNTVGTWINGRIVPGTQRLTDHCALHDGCDMDTLEDLIGSAEVCRLLGIDRSTLVRRVQAGSIPAAVKAPGSNGAYLFDRELVTALASGRAK